MSKILGELMPKQPENSALAYRTCFSSISYYGYKLDILKSGLQKYLRRRELDKMLWCLGEIYLFKVYAENATEKRATKGIITNMINRLIIMLDEELLFAEWDKYIIIRNLMQKFEDSGRDDILSLIKICKILCTARLLRRNSDIRAYYCYAMKKKIKNAGITVSAIEERGDDEDIDNWHFRNFKAYFEECDRKCFYWLYKIYDGKRESSVKRFNRKENIYMIWEYLYKTAFGNAYLKKCLDYRLQEFNNKSRKERCIFLTAAVDLCLERLYINWDPKLLQNVPTGDITDVQKIFKNREKLVIDDYVIDMHTSLGRKLGKNAINFMAEGALVVNEDKEYLIDEWRTSYNEGKLESYAAKLAAKKKKALKKVEKKVEEKVEKKEVSDEKPVEKEVVKKKGKTDREKARAAKYKKIKKMRGKPDFNDLEKDLKFVDGLNIQKEKIKLCSEQTCGNKVMCFEYEGKIWKESRKSMFYNRDYCVLDACKEYFGLRKIGMERVLSNFRIEKIDKSKKSWAGNWQKVIIKKEEEKVVYCVMNKITHCNWKVPMEISVIKHSFPSVRSQLKEFVKIGVFRGIFRCSDFNCRNVLVGCDKSHLPQYFVSIDEGDIGKRLDIIGRRERWLIKALNKDKTIINEILTELTYDHTKIIMCLEEMERYKFGVELRDEVENNWKNLRKDLEAEGIEF